MPSQSPDQFTVKFGEYARTLEYDDPLDHIVFTFDIGSKFDFKNPNSEHNKSLCLEHHPRRFPRSPRYALAFERAKQFLESRGYKVEESGTALLPTPLTAEEVLAFIRGQIHQQPPPSISLVEPPVRATFEDDASAVPWNLWVVAELNARPHRGHKLVFDELTKQFGVASPTNVFLGFWGSFTETLEALLHT